MATIKALQTQTVHQIQSGQVIVDLCSVVKELLENSIDAGATSIEIRFKDHGLDSIEVQDNGAGIAPDNYASLARKHQTSKLTTYDDLSSLQTFGFRGEALSSLCAFSRLHVITAQAEEAPKGRKLNFESSGELRDSQVVACQKGTTVVVEGLFLNLPVRRRELEKNIKREYGKVLGILQAYACITTSARIAVSNVVTKGKKIIAFATKQNTTTKESIANVFGSRTSAATVAMDLEFTMQGSRVNHEDDRSGQVRVQGHVSRPSYGEGRNAPDRQMFFVNGRPCGLPQVAKVFNEVYKSYNVTQSPFIFANIVLDTNAYDVNVSPDKRTILLHDQGDLLGALRSSLTNLFDEQDQVVPESQALGAKVSAFLSPLGAARTGDKQNLSINDIHDENAHESEAFNGSRPSIIERSPEDQQHQIRPVSKDKHAHEEAISEHSRANRSIHRQLSPNVDEQDSMREPLVAPSMPDARPRGLTSVATQELVASTNEKTQTEQDIPVVCSGRAKHYPGIIQNAFERMRRRRISPEQATITIGTQTMSAQLGTPHSTNAFKNTQLQSRVSEKVSQRMQAFAAPVSGSAEVFETRQGISSASHLKSGASSDDEDEREDFDSALDERRKDLTPSNQEAQETESQDEDMDQQSDGPQLDVGDSDDEYIDDTERKRRDESRILDLIERAEAAEEPPNVDQEQRARRLLRSGGHVSHALGTRTNTGVNLQELRQEIRSCLGRVWRNEGYHKSHQPVENLTITPLTETHPTLVISKKEFSKMYIIGQFNLGFILATRNGTDLFIIDQHASDEKYNFERLQRMTVVQNQRLVHPRRLELTAVDEEIILEKNDLLLKNGFSVDIETSGDYPVGQRCTLVSLPMSKEVTFNTLDLEELIALLADHRSSSTTIPSTADTAVNTFIPRPSKIRRMFAMRACRSSIMIGKTLTKKQMEGVVRRMGEIDKPWNCPHGRPTMRHLCKLEDWKGWTEDDGLVENVEDSEDENEEGDGMERRTDWKGWLQSVQEQREDSGEEADGSGSELSADGKEDGDGV